MKKRLVLAAACCMPLVAAADIMGNSLGFADASLTVSMALGAIALIVTRRLQKG